MPGLVRFVLAVGVSTAVVLTSGCRGRQTRSTPPPPDARLSLAPRFDPAPAPGMLVPGESSVPLQSPGYSPGPSIPLAPPAQEFGDDTTYLPPPSEDLIAAPRDTYFPRREPQTSAYDFFPSGPPAPEEPQAENEPGRMQRFWNTLRFPIRRTGGNRK